MSLFDQVDLLQREWTDQFVQVDDSVAELKRFAGLTGQVKTVNMSGQALVEFDGSEDIGWYDIHPEFLTVVAGQTTKEQPTDTPADTPADETPAAAQAAAATTSEPATEPAAAPADTSKLSPLELARMQDASDNTAAPAPDAPAAEQNVAEETAVETEEVVEETVAEGETDSAAASVEIPDAEGPDRTAAILAACRALDGG